MNLRGRDNRIKFVKEYDIKPISHQKLLNGQYKQSVGGSELKDRYYCFSYKTKGNKDEKEKTFICGYYIAEDLLQLTNQSKLPLFNPLKADIKPGSNPEVNNTTNGNNGANQKKWNPLALQLSEAINLLISYINIPIDGALANIKLEVDTYYYSNPFKSKVKAVNTIIGKLVKDKTLTEMKEELAQKNQLREFDFSLLDEVIKGYNVESKFK
ncbi:hypothetical protein G9V09_12975 [Staphylococcus aureus]|nr:hypothetical protein [Staphylococcus aureus]NHE30931.1 hypothetical protein [Staphylococcus aureus]